MTDLTSDEPKVVEAQVRKLAISGKLGEGSSGIIRKYTLLFNILQR